jgi:hypothetical protein
MAIFSKALNRYMRRVAGPAKASSKLTTITGTYTGAEFDAREINSLFVTVTVTDKTATPTLKVIVKGGDATGNLSNLSPDSGNLVNPAKPSTATFRVDDVPDIVQLTATCSGEGADVTFAITSEGK